MNTSAKPIKMRNGYISYYIPDHHLANNAGLVYEHELVAEEILGRQLEKCEVVHHIDGNRSNNEKANLMVFKTNGDHASYHGGGKLILNADKTYSTKRKINTCVDCGVEISPKATRCKACSRLMQQRRYTERPDKSTLAKLIKNTPAKVIAKMYGVSDRAVGKWLKKYGLINDFASRMKGKQPSSFKEYNKKQKEDKKKNQCMIDGDEAYGCLANGEKFLFDKEYYEIVSKEHWKKGQHGNVVKEFVNSEGNTRSITMACFLFGKGSYIHINGNLLDNRKENLKKRNK